jgi:hypothetical protein
VTKPLTSEDYEGMFAPWADEATYTPPAGEATDVSVMLDQGTKVLVTEAGEVIESEDRVIFMAHEVAEPVRDAVVAIGSRSWLLGALITRNIDADGAGTVTMDAQEQA